MRKHHFLGLVMAMICLLPTSLFAQSTQGTDFWVTLMRGDTRAYDRLILTFSAQDSTKVFVDNDATNLHDTFFVAAHQITRDTLCTNSDNAKEDACYVTDEHQETPVYRALHVRSEKPISLIAANYKSQSFDVAAILPTTALMSEYRIQCYTPYDHEKAEGKSGKHEQGSHFAIVATEDNVLVDITPTAPTSTGKPAHVTFTTDTLKLGQVYYVWSGQDNGGDFTGTVVKARNNKKIAVFNGNSHTNIPNMRDRDHIYSQAMPVNYWGKRFAITSSLTTIEGQDGKYWERIDKIRVQALVDGTVVKIDGNPVHTFDFVNGSEEDKKHFYEFDFGAKDAMNSAENINTSKPEKSQYAYKGDGHDYFEGASHYIETSCPSAVHLFMTSNRYDHDKVDGVNTSFCNGDPSEIWINPIEQKIDSLTFGTFQTSKVEDHFLNIVTLKSNVKSVILDGDSIYNLFNDLTGNTDYVFCRYTDLKDTAHTLTADSGFIAHVYGFGNKESYGYPAGGRTNDLTAFITINGKTYRADADNDPICGNDTVRFGAELNYEFDSIYWNFGDGQDTITYPETDTLPHFYELAGVYKGAYALIYRHMNEDDECINFSAFDSIAFIVNVGNYKIDIDSVTLPYCSKKGDSVKLTIYLNNPAGVSLTSDSVKLTFDAASKAAGFDESTILYQGDTLLSFPIPTHADGGVDYGFHLHIGSECPNSGLDKDLPFTIEYDDPLLAQRYNNVLGLIADSVPSYQVWDNFYWMKDDQVLPNEKTSVLVIEDNESNNGEYKLCYTIKEAGKPDKSKCTCPILFTASTKKHEFAPDTTSLAITATYVVDGQKVFVNADWEGKTGIECYAQWITSSGNAYQGLKFDIPDGGCTIPVPAENGFYILRVITDGSKRSFKFIINH